MTLPDEPGLLPCMVNAKLLQGGANVAGCNTNKRGLTDLFSPPKKWCKLKWLEDFSDIYSIFQFDFLFHVDMI